MDKAISASEASQRFSELLCNVSKGDSFVVMSRGCPVALITPVDRVSKQGAVQRLLGFVSALPVRHSGAWSRNELYK
jgi:prevent-host-death family protein